MWFHCVCVICTLQSALGRCHVWCLPHLQSFPLCSSWHDIDIVLSIPTLELVSKSRFNLHASCLQEEEVEEFRVSLSWYWFPSISFWPSRNEIFPAPIPPPTPTTTISSACTPPPLLYLSLCVYLYLCVINPSIRSAHSHELYWRPITHPINCTVPKHIYSSHIVAWNNRVCVLIQIICHIFNVMRCFVWDTEQELYIKMTIFYQ